jgi:hypothetical protein
MVEQKNTQTMEATSMEIETIEGQRAIPPWGDLSSSGRGLRPRTPGKGLTPFAILCFWYLAVPEGDILTLLEKGHFNFAQRGDILTLL